MKNRNRHNFFKTSMLLLVVTFTACKKFVELGAPPTQVLLEDAFKTDATAQSAVLGLYTFANASANGLLTHLHFYPGISSDELQYNAADAGIQEIAGNAILTTNGYVATAWSIPFQLVKNANNAISGLEKSTTLTASVKSQLLGEAKFMRAFTYFHLVNMFGGVPLMLTDDYDAFNKALLPRASALEVYTQIIKDLTDAKNLLPTAYVGTLKGRINKHTATALLARVYLYQKDYTNAEAQATEVISSGTYTLGTPGSAFVNTSSEIIWQIGNIAGVSVQGASYVTATTVIPTYTLADVTYRSFESNDLRRTNWTVTKSIAGKAYYGITKYKINTGTGNEYNVVFRLAELYLIRAEARVQLNNLTGAGADLNIIRSRAGLPNIGTASTQPELLLAVEQERKVELFGEWGHRWYDLKRTNRARAVLSTVKPAFETMAELFPIPQTQVIINTNLIQNPGY